jgi:predicted anti-sigma-YlaC factor YlaD
MAEHLSAYLDGELDAGLREVIERHGGECPPCRKFIDTLARTVEAVRSQPRTAIPAELIQALTAALKNQSR